MPLIATDDGARINVAVDGPDNAPALILSNSLGADLTMWDAQMPDFTRHFRVIRYDRRGHGKSDVPKGPYSMERFGRDIIAVLDALGVQKTNWCGLSMGGMVGMWLGANAPDRVERLVLSNTAAKFPSPDPWNDRIKTVTEKGVAPLGAITMERWFTQGFHDRAPEKTKKMLDTLLKTPPEGYIASGYAIRDMTIADQISRIRAPTLIIAGQHDQATNVEAAEFMQSKIPGAKLVVLDAAHISNIEQQEAYTKAVLDHLLAK